MAKELLGFTFLLFNWFSVNAAPTTSSQPVAYYLWDFGDGTVGTGLHATHNYVYCHDYDVKLTVYTINSTGKPCTCYDDEQHTVSITEGCMADRRSLVSKTIPTNTKVGQRSKNQLSIIAVPNPFKNDLTVSFKIPSWLKDSKGALSVIDANGKTIMTQSISSYKASIHLDTTPFASGVYLLMMQGADGTKQATQVVKIK